MLPLFQSQTEAINMEMPCLCVSLISVFYLIDKKVWLAALFAILATLIKGHGLIVCGVVVLYSYLLALMEYPDKKRYWFIGSLVAIFAVLKVKLTPPTIAGLISKFVGWPSLKQMPLTYVYCAIVAIFILKVVLDIFKAKRISFKEIIQYYYCESIVVVAAGGLVFSIFTFFSSFSSLYFRSRAFCGNEYSSSVWTNALY